MVKKSASCVCGFVMSLCKNDGAIVLNSQSSGFITTVVSDVALALCSDGAGSISIVSASGIWSDSTKVTPESALNKLFGSS